MEWVTVVRGSLLQRPRAYCTSTSLRSLRQANNFSLLGLPLPTPAPALRILGGITSLNSQIWREKTLRWRSFASLSGRHSSLRSCEGRGTKGTLGVERRSRGKRTKGTLGMVGRSRVEVKSNCSANVTLTQVSLSWPCLCFMSRMFLSV